MVFNDPDFAAKAVDAIGLYLNPRLHAVMFCMDGKTTIQALDCINRMLPRSPGRAERHDFEYERNSTPSLFATLNMATGEVLGKTAPRYISTRFGALLTETVPARPDRKAIHVIRGNVSSHKTDAAQALRPTTGLLKRLNPCNHRICHREHQIQHFLNLGNRRVRYIQQVLVVDHEALGNKKRTRIL
ncbi:putative transposase [Burkholderia lata]|uniref:Putative transposase n=1 Tax=Burkholderia lata (strain ATCC 17760 / DSM 23089 / LMG 22485 / NCIMB 9086 / R18194 / 383) TaxID=482957 RepID=A0A6P2X2S5_BURL3|nr:putative transposase [Burkholderia lata]